MTCEVCGSREFVTVQGAAARRAFGERRCAYFFSHGNRVRSATFWVALTCGATCYTSSEPQVALDARCEFLANHNGPHRDRDVEVSWL